MKLAPKSTAETPPKGLTTLTFFFIAAYTHAQVRGRSLASGAQGVK